MLIVRDRHGTTLDAKLPDLQGDTIKSFLRPVVARDALLVSDGAKVYGSFAGRSASSTARSSPHKAFTSSTASITSRTSTPTPAA